MFGCVCSLDRFVAGQMSSSAGAAEGGPSSIMEQPVEEAVEPSGQPELLPDQAAAERTASAAVAGSEPSPLPRSKKLVSSVAWPCRDGLLQSLVSLGSV